MHPAWDTVADCLEAWLAGDLDAVAASYLDAAVLVAQGELRIEGRDAIVRSYADYLARAQTLAFEVLDYAVDPLGDQAAVASFRFGVRYRLGDGVYEEIGQEVLVLRRRGEAWRIAWRNQVTLGG